jgi:hypothetical protein
MVEDPPDHLEAEAPLEPVHILQVQQQGPNLPNSTLCCLLSEAEFPSQQTNPLVVVTLCRLLNLMTNLQMDQNWMNSYLHRTHLRLCPLRCPQQLE